MKDLQIRFSSDDDGALASLHFVPTDGAGAVDGALELSLLLAGDNLGADPVLAIRELTADQSLFRSGPLPGDLFFRLKGVWESRRGEGFRVYLEGPTRQELPVESFALDFGGHLARGRAHEAAGRWDQAVAEFRATTSPTGPAEIARVEARRANVTSPPPAPAAAPALQDEAVILEILRAIAADGKVDANEMRTLQGLGAVFQTTPARLKQLLDQVKGEPRPSSGAPMVPADVLRDLIRKAVDRGRIGPGSTQVLRRAARVLQIDVETLKAIARGA